MCAYHIPGHRATFFHSRHTHARCDTIDKGRNWNTWRIASVDIVGIKRSVILEEDCGLSNGIAVPQPNEDAKPSTREREGRMGNDMWRTEKRTRQGRVRERPVGPFHAATFTGLVPTLSRSSDTDVQLGH